MEPGIEVGNRVVDEGGQAVVPTGEEGVVHAVQRREVLVHRRRLHTHPTGDLGDRHRTSAAFRHELLCVVERLVDRRLATTGRATGNAFANGRSHRLCIVAKARVVKRHHLEAGRGPCSRREPLAMNASRNVNLRPVRRLVAMGVRSNDWSP